MENGSQMTLDEFAPQIFPQQTSGASGSHARTSPSPESKSDFTETARRCFSELCTWLDNSKKKKDPLTCSLRTLKICLVLMEDGISPDFSLKWTGGGYDAEWSVLNSKYFGVPQNRERCFIIGHLRGRSTAEVFPVEGTNRADNICGIGHRRGYRRNTQIFDPDGITEALDTGAGGGRGHHTIEEIGIDVVGHTRLPKKNFGEDRERVLGSEGLCVTLRSTDYKDPTKVAIPAKDILTNPLYNSRGVVHDVNGISKTIIGAHAGNEPKVAIPVLTPDSANKRQNGRRFKKDGDEAYTLTGQDRHGVAVSIETSQELTVYVVWYPQKQCYIAIRKLTPKECFRLQGWTDDYFEKAQLVNSDSQLYKQAGNGVTVSVIAAIARGFHAEDQERD